MRDLAIAYGSSRQAKKWVNKTISYDDLKERLRVTIRTPESAEEYARMSKAQRDLAKDHGGFVGGALHGGRRKIDTVDLWSMVALDGDRIDAGFLDNYESIAPYASCLYTTHTPTRLSGGWSGRSQSTMRRSRSRSNRGWRWMWTCNRTPDGEHLAAAGCFSLWE